MAILFKGGILGNLVQGRLGDKIYSVRDGKTYVRNVTKRTAPPTEAMKAQQVRFKKAVSLSSILQSEMKKAFTITDPGEMHNKIVSATTQWFSAQREHPVPKGNHTPAFIKCSLAKGSWLTDRWRNYTQFLHSDGLVSLTIPEFIPGDVLYGPQRACYFICKIMVAVLDPETGVLTESAFKEIKFDYDYRKTPAQVIEFAVPHVEGSLIVTAMGLEFQIRNMGLCEAAKYMPAAIMNVEYK